MTPNECVLETLERYGEQAREVQLTLIHNGPLGWDPMGRGKIGRYQPCPPLRRKEAGGRLRRGSSSLSLHRQSLPPLTEQQAEEVKRPKRKSLTIVEEAWEWLESLGKGKVYSTASEKDLCKKNEKRNRTSLEVTLSVCKDSTGRNSKAKVKSEKAVKPDLDHQTSCCIGSQTRTEESKYQEATIKHLTRSATEDEKHRLIETITRQRNCLHELQTQIAHVDRQIHDIEEQQKARRAEEEAQQKVMEEELEQIMFWENELKAEEGHEKDLQSQFLEMKAKVVECKVRLEEYKGKIQGLDFVGSQKADSEINSGNVSKDLNKEGSDADGDVTPNRKLKPREDGSPPHALVAPCQIKERRPTGPAELREWWTRWSQAQKTQNKVIHRSELTIYLGSTKV